MRELAVQSATGTLTASDRTNLNAEFQALNTEIGDQVTKANFNGVKLLDGSATALTIQTGAKTGETISANLVNASAFDVGGDVTSVANANTALTAIDTQLDNLNTGRATLGAGINRLDAAVSNLSTTMTNLSSARGRIMDADFASETANLTRSQILQQAGTAMLAQANQLPNNVLSLLR
jgi:flagellin